MTVTVTVDGGRCASCGNCVMIAPDVFDLDEEAIVVLLDPHPPEDQRDAVLEAARSCPPGVIQVT